MNINGVIKGYEQNLNTGISLYMIFHFSDDNG